MSNAGDYFYTSSLFCVRLLRSLHSMKGAFFMQKEEILFIQNQIGGYEFKNLNLLEQAFTRKSYTQENGGENNEILEFIGDKVIDIAVIRYLTKMYASHYYNQLSVPVQFRRYQNPEPFHCEKNEGQLTKLKQKLVEKKTLALRIDDLRFSQFLRMGEGDKKNNVDESPSVKEDLFEAIIGAVAIDCDYDYSKTQEVVETMLSPDMFLEDNEEADYVGKIYEWDDKKYNTTPLFRYFDGNPSRAWNSIATNQLVRQSINTMGTYELNHYNRVCQVKILNDLPVFEGYGKSNLEARKAACREAYLYLEKHNLLFSIKDEIDEPTLESAINQLETLSRRGYFSIPEYVYEESHDDNGNPVWHVECYIEEMEYYYSADDSSKKRAKKEAAFDMLNYVLENYEE